MSVHPWVFYVIQLLGLLVAMGGAFYLGRWYQADRCRAAWERLEEQRFMDEVED